MTDLELPTVELVDDMAGFPDLRRFVLVRVDEAGLLFSLRSLDDEHVRFLVVPPAPFFPDYAPEIDDEAAARLELSDADDALLLLVVTAAERPEEATANLLAPLVVNRRTCAAAQVVLSGADVPLRAPLRG
jgi:flagellar assembly factor FliW